MKYGLNDVWIIKVVITSSCVLVFTTTNYLEVRQKLRWLILDAVKDTAIE